ncbi:hypothetical protein CFC21_038884, partial [Triticum aestivum]
GAVLVSGADSDVPRGGGVEPVLHGNPGGVRKWRWRCESAGHHGVATEWRQDGSNRAVGAHEGVMGVHLEDGCPPPHAGAILLAHHQRVRQDTRRRPGHPRRLEAQQNLQFSRPV